MRYLVVLVGLLFSSQSLADTINFGDASHYNIFVKENYQVNSSDVEGRVAVGGNLTVNGGYDIGTQINDFNMGTGPSLVVGGDITKTGGGFFNVYQSATLPSPVLGDVVLGGNLVGGPSEIGSITENSSDLPVNFDSAFSHLEQLSKQLSDRTAVNANASENWKLDFTPAANTTPADDIYVFNITADQLTQDNGQPRTDWHLDISDMAEGATVVFNIESTNGSTVDFTQSNILLNGVDPLSDYFVKGGVNGKPPVQVLYNFYGASQLNLKTDLYGSILAPTADIKANSSVIWGQVIGKSWQGNMQINYNPFIPTSGTTPNPVPEPATLLIFLVAFLLLIAREKLTFTAPNQSLVQRESFA